MTPDLRAAFVEQIRRDTETLRMPADLIAPSREFYVERIAGFRAVLGVEPADVRTLAPEPAPARVAPAPTEAPQFALPF